MTETDRGERGGERGRQRCYRRRDKWKMIDVGENHMGGDREGLRLDTE